jgi:CarD family transcriptional regulator
MGLKTAFKVGDTVFYPSAGVGVIQATEDLYIDGRSEPCYIIHIHQNQVTIKVPRTNLNKNGIRRPLDGKKAKEIFKILSANGARRATGGNWAERCKELERRINTGSCLELAAAVRDLMHWKKKAGLSFEESRLLAMACGYLSDELAAVEGIPAAIAYDHIQRHVAAVA